MSVFLRGNCKRAHRHSGECKHYHFTFNVRGRRYRGAIPEARTKWQAEQAELRIRQDVYEGRFGKTEAGTTQMCEFIDRVYLPWAKANKRSWKDDEYKLPVLKAFFRGQRCAIQHPSWWRGSNKRDWPRQPNKVTPVLERR